MDRKLFEEGSAVLTRSLEYASKMEELHIIVFSLKKHGLQIKKVNNLSIYPTNSSNRISFLFDAYRLGKKIIKKNNFELGKSVITVQDYMGVIGYALSKKFKFPLQLQIHTDLFSLYFKNSLFGFFNFWYSGWVHVPLTKFLIPRVSGLRVVSEVIADSIKDKFPHLKIKPDILPVFVDIEKIIQEVPKRNIKSDYPQFDHIVFMASRWSNEKRIDIAFHAFVEVIKKFPQAGLVLLGGGQEEHPLQDFLPGLGLSKNVVLLPWQNDLISYYKTADIFLLTSEYEGYGMTLIEAGASGCPVVTTDVGIAKTNLFKDGENSFVCPVGDVDCLANRIVELLSDSTKRNLFKQRMQDSIKSTAISKEEYASRYVSLLEKLL